MAEVMPGMADGMEWIAGRLLSGSIQGALVITVLWLVCRRFASIPASIRTTLWWLASLKLVLALLSLPSIPVPILSPEPVTGFALDVPREPVTGLQRLFWRALRAVDRHPAFQLVSKRLENSRKGPHSGPIAEVPTASDARALAPSQVPAAALEEVPPVPSIASSPQVWMTIAIGLWTIGVFLHVARLMVAMRSIRRVSSRARPVGGDEAAHVARLAGQLGLRTPPDVRLSDDIHTPQVAGIWRPIVLLPSAGFDALAEDERAMVLCHELVHIRRRDLLWGWVPICAERLFFFHPLARLAAREYLIAREAACDAAVLSALGLAPHAYGRMLVRLGIAGTEPGFSAAGSSKSATSLKRRLDMLRHSVPGGSRRAVWVVGGLIAISMVPMQPVARAELQRAVPAPNAIAERTLDEPLLPEIPSVAAASSRAEAGAQQGSGLTRTDVGSPGQAAAIKAEWEAAQAEYRVIVERETALQRAREQQNIERALDREQQAYLQQLEALRSEQDRLSRTYTAEHPSRQALSEQIRQVEQATRESSTDFLRERLAELNAQMRELERALRQQKLDPREQKTVESLRDVRELMEAARAARARVAVDIDQQAPLERQIEQWQRSQQQLARQVEDLVKQQEALRDAQQRLVAEAERLRAAVAGAKPQAVKPEAVKPEAAKPATPTQPLPKK